MQLYKYTICSSNYYDLHYEIVSAEQGGYLHGECLEMVDRLKALRGEVLNEVLAAQTG